MSIVSPGNKVACRVNVPDPMAARARYALENLLVPLGLDPVWAEDARIVYDADGRADVHNDGGSRSHGVLYLPVAEWALEYFARRSPYDNRPGSLSVSGERFPIPFVTPEGQPDVVASTFLLLSGWHEAASPQRDEHGRVPFESTLPAFLGIHDTPVVDVWRDYLSERLAEVGISTSRRRWNGHEWALSPTHDIDYTQKWRPGILYRELVEYPIRGGPGPARMSRSGRFRATIQQLLRGDPYREALPRMVDEVVCRGGTATYFIKAGGGDPHDVPYSLSSRLLRRHFAELRRRGFETALHPSYASAGDRDRLLAERDRLTAVTAAQPLSVRQHYLRYDPQTSPGLYAELGFQIDSTVGFVDRAGFRRGTCQPFRLYDLEKDRPLDMWEMPLTFMESAIFNRQAMTAREADEHTDALMAKCRRFGGVCVGLWHNTLWDEIDCAGWGAHFTRTLDEAARHGALIASLENALRSWR